MATSGSTPPAWTRASRRATISIDYANGTWVKNTPIPAGQVALRHVQRPRRSVEDQRTRQIIDEQAKDPNSKIGTAYSSFMDEAAIEAKGLTPFEPWLEPDPRH